MTFKKVVLFAILSGRVTFPHLGNSVKDFGSNTDCIFRFGCWSVGWLVRSIGMGESEMVWGGGLKVAHSNDPITPTPRSDCRIAVASS